GYGDMARFNPRDGIENTFGENNAPGAQQFGAGKNRRLPYLAFIATYCTRFQLAESLGFIEHPLPERLARQLKTHGCATGVNVVVLVILLGVPALNFCKVEAAAIAQVAIGHGGWVFGAFLFGFGLVAFRPAFKQEGEQLFNVVMLAAVVQPAAFNHPG